MKIKDNAFYPITEVQRIVNWSSRKLQRYAKKNNLQIIDNRYIFKGYEVKKIIIENDNNASIRLKDATQKEMFSLMNIEKLKKELENLKKENAELKTQLKEDIPHQDKLKKAIQLITIEAIEKGWTHKVFTENEYQDLIGTISEVEFQTEQVQYLRTRVEKQDLILNQLVKQVSERNYIEAKEKGLD